MHCCTSIWNMAAIGQTIFTLCLSSKWQCWGSFSWWPNVLPDVNFYNLLETLTGYYKTICSSSGCIQWIKPGWTMLYEKWQKTTQTPTRHYETVRTEANTTTTDHIHDNITIYSVQIVTNNKLTITHFCLTSKVFCYQTKAQQHWTFCNRNDWPGTARNTLQYPL